MGALAPPVCLLHRPIEVDVQAVGGVDVEVESLTDAGQRGLGVRCWIDHRSGYAYGTDLTDDGLRGIAAGSVEAARIADPDEFTAAPPAAEGEAPEIAGLVDPALATW